MGPQGVSLPLVGFAPENFGFLDDDQQKDNADETDAPDAEHIIIELRFWKSYTPSGDEKRAVPEVGNTWLGPAQ